MLNISVRNYSRKIVFNYIELKNNFFVVNILYKYVITPSLLQLCNEEEEQVLNKPKDKTETGASSSREMINKATRATDSN